MTQQTRHIYVYDGGPTFKQHWDNILRLLRLLIVGMFTLIKMNVMPLTIIKNCSTSDQITASKPPYKQHYKQCLSIKQHLIYYSCENYLIYSIRKYKGTIFSPHFSIFKIFIYHPFMLWPKSRIVPILWYFNGGVTYLPHYKNTSYHQLLP